MGRVKIGDFGLARFDTAAPGAGDDDGPPPSGPSADTEPSGAVGTFLYTAPEVTRGLPHDSKVDLFATGVIAYELLRRFDTGMQRVAELSELRTAQRLPPGFAATFPKQAALIVSLVAPDPTARPSAADVLRSDAMPPRVGDEHLSELLRSLGESGAAYDAVVHRIFAADSAGARAAARGTKLDADAMAAAAAASAAAVAAASSGPLSPPGAAASMALERVCGALRGVFRRHGAEPCFGSRSLGFASSPQPPGAVHVLDTSGALLGLRDEMRGRFVACLAAHAAAGAPLPAVLRRYELAHILRASSGAPLPREIQQADFDIVGPAEAPPGATNAAASMDSGVCACDAEVIRVALDVAESVGLGRGAIVLLSHRELLSAVWRVAGVPADARGRAAALLRGAPPMPAAGSAPSVARDAAWAALRRQLCGGLGLAPQVVERLDALHRVGGEPSSALPRLRGALRAASGSKAAGALDALASVTSLLTAMGVVDGVCIAPLLAPAESAWSGMFFEVVVPIAPSSRGGDGAMAVLAAGGRYDALLAAHWPPGADAGPPGGVGVSFSATRMAALATVQTNVNALDILVAARGGGGLLRARLELTSALWDAGMRAETLPAAAPSLTEQYAHAACRSVRWLLILSENGAVRVKHVSGVGRAAGREEDVPRGEIVRHMATLVGSSNLERGASVAGEATDFARSLGRRSSAAEDAADADASDAADETIRVRGGRRRRAAANVERRDVRTGTAE